MYTAVRIVKMYACRTTTRISKPVKATRPANGSGAKIAWYQPLLRAPRLSILITALGVSLALENGVLLLYGEGIQPGALLTGARLMDVVPTLMYGMGFPVAHDLDGRVLTTAFDKRFLARHPIDFMPTYEGLMERPAATRP